MSYTLQFEAKHLSKKIKHSDQVFLIGSCFTEHMTDYLNHAGFNTLSNPHGILFNPLSVTKSMDAYVNCEHKKAADLFYLNELWNSWDHHTRFSDIDKETALNEMNAAIDKAHAYIKQCDWLIITLGSAFQYHLIENKYPVANNHRAPGQWFEKELLSIATIQQALTESLEKVKAINPSIEIIFTISPVRHIRDGVVENNRSKARLIEVVHNLTNKYNYMHYFPAYELIIDVLRDYRFYDIDLVHPNFAATAAVWESFKNSCIEPLAFELMNSIEQLFRASRHKSRFPATEAHQNFIAQQIALANQLKKSHPYLKMEQLIAEFEQNK